MFISVIIILQAIKNKRCKFVTIIVAEKRKFVNAYVQKYQHNFVVSTVDVEMRGKMLNLHYILLYKVPEEEKIHIKRNIAGAKELECIEVRARCEENEAAALKASAQAALRVSEHFPPEECLAVSADRIFLQMAADGGMATVCYLPPAGEPESILSGQGTEQDKVIAEKTAAGEQTGAEELLGEEGESAFAPDMYAEGFEETDAVFFLHVYQRHHNLPWTILITERCIVKEFSMDYLDALFELYAGDGMTDYIEPLYPYEKEKEYQQAYIENMYRFYSYGMWIVCQRETGKLIGRAGVEHREELDGEPELGYAIGTEYQRQGYATEVCKAILSYVQGELEFDHVCCLIHEENLISRHFAEKLGFQEQEAFVLQNRKMIKYALNFKK
jgi:RimJ/RimL family protein N-acetyltransferase